MTVEKPPYRVPSMAEVAAVRGTNGLTVASSFSGCGGSCLGFEMAGYDVRWASEFIPAAQEVYRLNHPGTVLDTRDIREVRAEEVLSALRMEPGELDVWEGSPPCASFSTAGKRSAHWGQVNSYSDSKQRTDDLFFEYVRLLDGIQPRSFVAENVSGLIKGVAKGYFIEILRALKGCGYRVEAKVLDAQWLGVPQARKRVIFMGVRNDLGLDPHFPAPLPYRYSIRDALPWLTAVRYDTSGHFERRDLDVGREPVGTITLSGGAAPLHWKVEGAAPPESGWEAADRRAREVGLDEPVPTVLTHNRGWNQVAVRMDEEIIGVGDNGAFGGGGMRSPDLPVPTLGASPNTGNGRFPPSLIEVRRRGEPPVAGPPVHVRQNEDLRGEAEEGVAAGLEGYAVGPEWDKLKPGETSERYFNLVRSHPDRPLSTLTAAGGQGGNTASVTHPTEKRKFTIAELRRLCAFPDDFSLTGTYAQQWERLGRAVPPLMMRAVAESLRDGVLLR